MRGVRQLVSIWFPPFAWAGAIYLMSAQPSLVTPLGKWDFLVRKIAHAVEYAVLAALVARVFSFYGAAARRTAFYAFLIAVLYAFTDEYHQSLVPGRFAAWTDVLIDSFGAAISISFLDRIPVPKRSL